MYQKNQLLRVISCSILVGLFLLITHTLPAQSINNKIHADYLLSKVETIEYGERKLDSLRKLFDFYEKSNDPLKSVVLDIIKKNALEKKDDNYWAWYYFKRSLLENTIGGNVYLLSNDSAYNKAMSMGNFELMVRIVSEKAGYLGRNHRYKEALDANLIAVELSEKHHFQKFLPYRYMTTSGVYKSLGDTARQYAMALKASEAANALNDLEARANTYANLANIYVEKKQYSKALELQRSCLEWFLSLNLPGNAAYVQLDLANVYSLINKFDTAKLYANAALRHFSGIKNKGYLKDANAVLADIYEKNNLPDSAIIYYNTSIAIGTSNNNPLGNDGFHKALSEIYFKKKSFPLAYEHLQLYLKLHDSIINIEKNRAIEETSVKYETEKKNDAIVSLNKDRTLNKQLISRQRSLRNVLIAGLFLLLIVGFLLYNRIQLRKKIEQQQAITHERERIITDLHDDVGATLSSMSIYSDLAGTVWETKPFESRKLVDKIANTSRDLMVRMGDIIWSMKDANDEKYSYETRIKNYTKELLAPKNIHCSYIIDENLFAFIKKPEVRKNLLLITKEAINNISKYSEASQVKIFFGEENQKVKLVIQDNGKGYNPENNQLGNGLQNMRRRCESLMGVCSISTASGQGVTVNCTFEREAII